MPPQKRPEDFGIHSEDAEMSEERAWLMAQQQASDHEARGRSLSQLSRQRRKNIRPYLHINRQAQRIGARRQMKQSRHG